MKNRNEAIESRHSRLAEGAQNSAVRLELRLQTRSDWGQDGDNILWPTDANL